MIAGDREAVGRLLIEIRKRREALRALVGRLQRDRHHWERDQSELLRRARLTTAQRQALRNCLRPHSRPPDETPPVC